MEESNKNHFPRKTGIKRIISATTNSYNGLKYLLKEEKAFIQEILLIIPLSLVIFLLEITKVEKTLLFASLVLILIVEVLNTAIERTIDRIGYERHKLSAIAKDLGSLAVLISLLLALIIWLVVLL